MSSKKNKKKRTTDNFTENPENENMHISECSTAEDEEDEYEQIKGIIRHPKTADERNHNVYLRVMHEYRQIYEMREKCLKTGLLFILISAAVFLALMFSLDSKAFFLVLWIVFILASITVIVRIDYRCYKYERILGLKQTEKEDDVEKFRMDVIRKTDDVRNEVSQKKDEFIQKTNDVRNEVSQKKDELIQKTNDVRSEVSQKKDELIRKTNDVRSEVSQKKDELIRKTNDIKQRIENNSQKNGEK